MSLIKEANNTIKQRNWVAKNAHQANTMRSAGEHEVKTKHSKKKRLRDKQSLRSEVRDY